MKKFFEWLEEDNARGRRVMLISAVFSNIFITFILLALMAYGLDIKPFLGFYTAFLGLGLGAIGFYTGTKPSNYKSSKYNSKRELTID